MDTLISIIIPVFNSSDYLEECLKSVIKQTYENLQIILVDDGSTDNSLEIIKAYEMIDDRILWCSQPNKGAWSARNQGINLAKGEYIGFVDSDDIVKFDMYETMLKSMQNVGAEVCECNCLRLTKSGKRIEMDKLENNILFSNEILESFIKNENTTPSVANKLYKKEIIEGIYFMNLEHNEDYLFNFNVYSKVEKKITLNYIGYIYRENLNSVTNSSFTLKKLDTLRAKRKIISDLQNRHLDNLLPLAYRNFAKDAMRLYFESYRGKAPKKIQKHIYKEFKYSYKLSDKKIKFNPSTIAMSALYFSPYFYLYVCQPLLDKVYIFYTKLKSIL
ncbi:glycosyltransferase family 2 protein [Aerococcus tenax]|uniref:glycosyltransferase family 2 protein n=1 Tax=Aerococcus tenax TaxID=3078812 RepID=UPI0018A6FC63|nr:glycosyltransferase family 2 protein [Aerococcus tenax]